MLIHSSLILSRGCGSILTYYPRLILLYNEMWYHCQLFTISWLIWPTLIQCSLHTTSNNYIFIWYIDVFAVFLSDLSYLQRGWHGFLFTAWALINPVLLANSSCPNHTIRLHRSGSTLAKILACFLHQAITWTKVDLSSSGVCALTSDQFHRHCSRFKISIRKMSLKNIRPYLQGYNGLVFRFSENERSLLYPPTEMSGR